MICQVVSFLLPIEKNGLTCMFYFFGNYLLPRSEYLSWIENYLIVDCESVDDIDIVSYRVHRYDTIRCQYRLFIQIIIVMT